MDKQRNKEKVENNFANRIKALLKELIERNEVELFGNLEVEIVNMDTPALIKGNKIYVNINAEKYPNYILKYILAHELAHLLVKRHTKKFWEIVKRIYPQYEKGKNELLRRSGTIYVHKK